MLFLETGNAPAPKNDFYRRVLPWLAPTNPCSENKKVQKIENNKRKKKNNIPGNQPPP